MKPLTNVRPRGVLLAALALLAVLVAACVPTPSAEPTDPTPPPRTTPAGETPAPTVSPTPVPSGIVDGEHRVGGDISAGTYRVIKESADPGEDFCYWERISGFGGTEAEIIANNAGVGPRVVTISASDVGFRSQDCGTWTPILAPLPGPIGDGVWIVGSDVQPGRYHSDGGSACLWQRLAGFGWTSDESLAVGTMGEVALEAGDVGFSSSHCGQWRPAGA